MNWEQLWCLETSIVSPGLCIILIHFPVDLPFSKRWWLWSNRPSHPKSLSEFAAVWVPGLGEDGTFCSGGEQAVWSLTETLPQDKRELVTIWDVFSRRRMIFLTPAPIPELSWFTWGHLRACIPLASCPPQGLLPDKERQMSEQCIQPLPGLLRWTLVELNFHSYSWLWAMAARSSQLW